MKNWFWLVTDTELGDHCLIATKAKTAKEALQDIIEMAYDTSASYDEPSLEIYRFLAGQNKLPDELPLVDNGVTTIFQKHDN